MDSRRTGIIQPLHDLVGSVPVSFGVMPQDLQTSRQTIRTGILFQAIDKIPVVHHANSEDKSLNPNSDTGDCTAIPIRQPVAKSI